MIKTLRDACLDTGFLHVSEHGIAPAIIDRMRNAVKRVFSDSDGIKAAYCVTPGRYSGYIPLGFSSPAGARQKADNYEGFKLHSEVAASEPACCSCNLYVQNIWPPGLEDASAAAADYWRELDRVCHSLLRLFALALGKDEGHFLGFFEAQLTNMTLLH